MDDDMASLTQKIVLLEDKILRMEHVVNGNGQPGLSAKIEKLITEIYRLTDRLDRMEEHTKTKKTDWQWIATALIAIAAIAVQLLK